MSVSMLSCVGLTVRFGGLVALNGLSLEVCEGEVLGLIGPNGSGKTTFFNALTGIYRPAAGRVGFQGRDITGARPQAVYDAGVARTFQRSRLCLELSVFDNLMIGNHRNLDLSPVFNLLRRRAFAKQLTAQLDRAAALLHQFAPDLPARIYQPAKSAMSSGTARTRQWVLDFGRASPRELDPLMGWTSSNDTQAQVRLSFPTREAAVEYARENGIDAVVVEPKRRSANVRPRGYGENFATDRRGAWTH